MQKFIRIVAIIAAVLVGLSFLLLLVSTPFQRMIAGKVFTYSDELVGRMPIFPLPSFVNCFMLLGCTIILVVCAGNKKGGIWLELVVFFCIALVLPFLNNILASGYYVWMGQIRGDMHVAAISIVNTISSWCMWPGNLGNSLALVVCGMSIVFKRMSKKLVSNTNA